LPLAFGVLLQAEIHFSKLLYNAFRLPQRATGMALLGSKALHFIFVQAAAFFVSNWLVGADHRTLYSAVLWARGALILSMLVRNRWRWNVINFGFPLAVVGVSILHMPPVYFLTGFVFLAGFNWHVARNRVPYFPSSKGTWEVAAGIFPPSGTFSFADIGSGLGGLNFYLAKHFAEGRFTGVEISPIPWVISRIRIMFTTRCQFRRQDYNALDLSQFDVVFAYLSPAVMPQLWEKARREMRPGSVLLSFEFSVPGGVAHAVVASGLGGRPPYQMEIKAG
jgi:SAM-dependent methyltransferase